jgi:ABC-type branched-subunit amino acid transport system substrate-binding protein
LQGKPCNARYRAPTGIKSGYNRVTFLFEDDGFQPKNALSAAEMLISRDRVDALITFSSSTALVVAPLAERRKVPMISITSLTDVSKGR